MVTAVLLTAQLFTATPAPKAYDAGMAMVRRGRVQQAIKKFKRCRTNALCARGLGIAYSKAGNNKQALRWYRRYLAKSPDSNDSAQIELVMCHLSEGPCSIPGRRLPVRERVARVFGPSRGPTM